MKHILLLLVAFSLSACSVFGGGEVDLSEPVKLEKFDSQLKVTRQWHHDLGKGPGDSYPIVVPAIDGDRLFAADRDGLVTAIDLNTGKRLWKHEIKKTMITGATGASNGQVIVGTNKGEVIALSQEDGTELWRVSVNSEILAAPGSNGDVVVVLSLDGRIHGLNASDGSERWLVDTSMPLLTVRGNAAPLVVKNLAFDRAAARLDAVFVGLDNGKLAAYAMDDGVQLWSIRVGVPEGRTDLERMVDIDGQPLFHSGTLYGISFQGGLMAIEPATGRANWYQEASSNVRAGAYAGTLVITEADGTVKAFSASEGTELWSIDEYANRELNAPVATSGYVAFADYEGYLHFLSRRTGETIGRKKVDGSGVRSPMLTHNGQVIVLGNSGSIAAYSVTELD